MSRLTKLMGKPITKTIGGEDFEIKPLSLRHLELFLNMSDKGDTSKQADAMKKVLIKVIKQAVPDSTEDEIEDMDITYLQEWMTAITEVNGLGDTDEDKQGKTIKPDSSE